MPKFTKQEIKTYVINLICVECNEGSMVKNVNEGSISLLSNPPKFKHVCDKCGNVDWYTENYPKLTYEQIGVMVEIENP